MIVIFDLDGTVADTLTDLANAVNYGLRELGYPVRDTESIRTMIGNGTMKLCERALPDDKKADTDRLHAVFKEHYDKHYLDNTRLYDGIGELIRDISAHGIPVAVATNKPQDVAGKIIAELIPPQYSDLIPVLGGCDERPKKPAPDIIREILGKYPDSCDRSVMIGDSSVDVQTAKNAGLASIGCSWGFRGREELEKAGADFIVDSPAEILNILLEHRK